MIDAIKIHFFQIRNYFGWVCLTEKLAGFAEGDFAHSTPAGCPSFMFWGVWRTMFKGRLSRTMEEYSDYILFSSNRLCPYFQIGHIIVMQPPSILICRSLEGVCAYELACTASDSMCPYTCMCLWLPVPWSSHGAASTCYQFSCLERNGVIDSQRSVASGGIRDPHWLTLTSPQDCHWKQVKIAKVGNTW